MQQFLNPSVKLQVYLFCFYCQVCVLFHSVSLNFSSAEWKNLDDSQREKLGIKAEDDGEFWYIFIVDV